MFKNIKFIFILTVIFALLCGCANTKPVTLNKAVTINDDGTVSKETLESIKNSNGITVFNGVSNGFNYSFTVFGKDIKKTEDINLKVDIKKDENYIITFASNKDFGFSPVFQFKCEDGQAFTTAVLSENENIPVNVFGYGETYVSLSFPAYTGTYEIKPLLAENEKENVNLNKCSICIECSAIFSRIDELNPDKLELLPSDTFLLKSEETEISDGDTAFSVLQKICKEKHIALDSNFSAVYNTTYIKGIGNIYEKDCGETSGWGFKVNGEYPIYSCSDYIVNAGDEIVFCYF